MMRRINTRPQTVRLGRDGLTLGERFRRIRRHRDEQLTAVARALGTNIALTSRWEHDRVIPSLVSFAALAEHYGITIDDLYHGTPSGLPNSAADLAVELPAHIPVLDARIRNGYRLAAARLGISPEEYMRHRDGGERWCSVHQAWEPVAEFVRRRLASDGLGGTCRAGNREKVRHYQGTGRGA